MKNILFLFIPFLLLMSCGKGPETVTVQSNPSELFEVADSAIADPGDDGEPFVHIKLGEIAAIESLDPLFAESYSEFRVLNLIYQRLVQLNENGQPAPALAKRWEVNADSTRFTFHLDTGIYFHDSPVFGNGSGRRLTAGDVNYIFQRMASDQVSGFAGNYFNDIRGFENYRNELMYVKNPARQAIDSVEGITVQNDSTIVFNMKASAPDFLYRLAHPRASVYAKESVPEAGVPVQRSTGTGAFYFVKREGRTLIFARNNDYSGKLPDVDRLDIISGLEEKDLFQEFAREELDALIEVGPSTLLTIADSSGNLQTNYYPDYELMKTPVVAEYSMYLNKSSEQQKSVNAFISSLDAEAVIQMEALGRINTHLADSISPQDRLNTRFIITQTQHPALQYIIGKIAEIAAGNGDSFGMSPSYALSDETTFTTRPYPGTERILSWHYPVYVLTGKRLSGLKVLHEPWNMDVSAVQRAKVN